MTENQWWVHAANNIQHVEQRCRLPWQSNGECVGRHAIECSSFSRTDQSRRSYTPTCNALSVLSAAAASTRNRTDIATTQIE